MFLFIGDTDGFHTCVEETLSALDCFNFISESDEEREVLYNVCKFNYSVHYSISEDDQIEAIEDYTTFNAEFPTYKGFNDLFEWITFIHYLDIYCL